MSADANFQFTVVDSPPKIAITSAPVDGSTVPFQGFQMKGTISAVIPGTYTVSANLNSIYGGNISTSVYLAGNGAGVNWLINVSTADLGFLSLGGNLTFGVFSQDVLGNLATFSSSVTFTSGSYSGALWQIHVDSSLARTVFVDAIPPASMLSVNVDTVSMTAVIVGSTTDNVQVRAVSVAITDSNNRYWNGAGFVSSPPVFVPMRIVPGATAYWQIGPFDVDPSAYSIVVVSSDEVNNVGTTKASFSVPDLCAGNTSGAPVTLSSAPIALVKAAAIFRPLKYFRFIGHAGLYAESDSAYVTSKFDKADGSTTAFVAYVNANGLPTITATDDQHLIFEAETAGVQASSLNDFSAGYHIGPHYWGSREPVTPQGRMTAAKRNKAELFAARQLGKPYRFFSAWRGDQTLFTSTIGFRCDGLIVASYAQVSADPTNGSSSWLTHLPLRLYYQLSSVQPTSPKCAAITASAGSGGTDLQIPADGGAAGSGIDRVEFYRGDPSSTTSLLLGVDDHDSISADRYAAHVSCNPGKNLYAKIVDQAGNYSVCSGGSPVYGSVPIPSSFDPPATVGPTVSSISAVPDGSIAGNVQISWDVSPGDSAVGKIYFDVDRDYDNWDDGEGLRELTTQTGSLTIHVSSGSHVLYFVAFDENDNSVTYTTTFTVAGAALVGSTYVDLGNVRIDGRVNSDGFIAANRQAFPALPPGFQALANGDGSYEIWTTAQIQAPFHVAIKCRPGVYSSQALRRAHLFHADSVLGLQDITQAVDASGCSVTGVTSSASPFAILLPVGSGGTTAQNPELLT